MIYLWIKSENTYDLITGVSVGSLGMTIRGMNNSWWLPIPIPEDEYELVSEETFKLVLENAFKYRVVR